MWSPESRALGAAHRRTLLEVARAAIEYGLEHGQQLPLSAVEYAPELRQKQATFVTLCLEEELCGCIGSVQPVRPLVEDVAHNAYAAAFLDPRFSPCKRADLERLHIHISLLSHTEELSFASQAELLAQVRPGTDGLLLEEGQHRGTLLPSVWETLPEPEVFLRHLKRKAGLPAEYWTDTLKVYRYTTESVE
jgi:AmmeMemoRadiSam system protein A